MLHLQALAGCVCLAAVGLLVSLQSLQVLASATASGQFLIWTYWSDGLWAFRLPAIMWYSWSAGEYAAAVKLANAAWQDAACTAAMQRVIYSLAAACARLQTQQRSAEAPGPASPSPAGVNTQLISQLTT